jgi:hypothetical protein
MAENYKIFNDELIPGTADYALHSVRAACSVVDPERTEKAWRIVRAIACHRESSGNRVWFRITYPEGDQAFISINPGEHRTVQPTGGNDVVVELPPASSDDTSRCSP